MNKEHFNAFLRDQRMLSPERANQIAAYFNGKIIAKGQLILSAGKVSDDYLFLENGYMRAFAYNTEGSEVTTDFIAPGQFIFEVSSFFNRTRSQENIQALTDCEGWSITFKQLNELFHTMPEFRELGRSVLVKGFAGLKTRTLSMITQTAEERYEALLKTNPGIFQHAPLKNIASYLGITDTSLSRIRKDLARK